VFHTLLQDIRGGLRILSRNPAFAVVAILSLALGIGANTAIFTVIDAVFLNPLPVRDASHLIQIFTIDNKTVSTIANLNHTPSSLPNYEDYRDQTSVFSGLAAEGFPNPLTWGGQSQPEQLNVTLVTANYFDVLGVNAYRGRTFFPDEDKKLGGNPVAVLSYAMWTHRFGSDDAVVGRTITLNQQGYTIIGVSAPNFKGSASIAPADAIWVPISMRDYVFTGPLKALENDRRFRWLNMIGRLKPGVKMNQAEASLKTIASALEKQYPKENDGRTVSCATMQDSALGIDTRSQFMLIGTVMMSIVGFVLLIACVNLANLLLGQAARRQKEMSIRAAMGASRGRMVRQMLTESVVLSLAGGIAGIFIAKWGSSLLWSHRPPFLPADAISLSLDGRVLLFSLTISLITGIIFGAVPALRASTPNLMETLKIGGRGGSAARQQNIFRSALVTCEVALALVALVGAGLFLRSMHNAQKIDLGFESKKLMVMTFDVSTERYTQEHGEQFFVSSVNAVKAVPGVEDATISTNFPLGGSILGTVFKEGEQANPSARGTLVGQVSITPSYFNTVRVSLIEGRNVTEFDRDGSLPVTIITEAMAKMLWPNEDAINKRIITYRNPIPYQVIGVVRDSTVANIGETPQPVMFFSMRQKYSPAVTLQVRTTANPESVLGAIRQAVQSQDRDLALTNVQTITELIDQGLWAPKMGATLLGLFGALALILAAIGVYGVMAYSVTQRTNEIGIRMAMGAQTGSVLKLVLGQGIRLVLIGALVGNVAAWFLAHSVPDLLYGVSLSDPTIYAGVTLLLGAIALIACYVPAIRATRVDPIIALRTD
jgi:predicted permease